MFVNPRPFRFIAVFFSFVVAGDVLSAFYEDSGHERDISRIRTIFSMDGGGTRGIIEAIVLEEIDKKLSQPLVKYIDVMAGTSTGALIAMGLNIPKEGSENKVPRYPASEMVKVYEGLSPEIFGSATASPFRSLGGILGPYYKVTGLESVAEKIYGDTRLAESITNVIVPVFEITEYKPVLFSSYNAKQNADQDYYMRDVAVAASSAPTYFKPKEVNSLGGVYGCFIDGGVVLNNPAILGYTHANQILPDYVDNFLVSLGTGEAPRSLDARTMSRKGMVGWSGELISILMRSSQFIIDDQLQRIMSDYHGDMAGRRNYYRLQASISREQEQLDNASSGNMQMLKNAANNLVLESREEIEEISSQLERIMEARQNQQELHDSI